MRLIFSIFHLFTKCELVFLKNKFKNYGKTSSLDTYLQLVIQTIFH